MTAPLSVLIVAPHILRGAGLEDFYARALQELGHKVTVLSVDGPARTFAAFNLTKRRLANRLSKLRYQGQPPTLLAEHIVTCADSLRPDLTIVFRCERLAPETIRALREASRYACVNIYPDHPFVIPGAGAVRLGAALREYTAILTFARCLIPVFYQLGARSVNWLPFGYDPDCHVPKAPHRRKSIVYLGQWGYVQEEHLESLCQFGVAIYGVGWHHLRRASPLRQAWQVGEGLGPEMGAAVTGAEIVFNLVRAEAGCAHSMKTFEIPALCGFMLTNDTEEQKLFFRPDREAVYFQNRDELVDKVRYYLAHPDEREQVRLAGLAAVKGHEYTARTNMLLAFVATGVMPEPVLRS